LALAAGVAVSMGLLASPAPSPVPSAPARPNVLLVTIDTLRADRVGAYGYRPAHTPVLDRLARDGVRFEDATVQVPLTYPSHVAILTGRYPSAFGVRVNGLAPLPASVPTIATRFEAAGYRTAAFVASAILDPGVGLSRGFELYDAEFGRAPSANVALAELQRPAGEVIAAVNRWLDAKPASPWFAWVHLFDPHYPYEPPARFLELAGGRPYDGEVAYADASLGTLLPRIPMASTILVVMSDHGESLGEHGEDDHGFFLYDSTLKVPLIVRAPGIAPRVVREQVRSIDVAPTLAALAGLPSEGQCDGESLVPLLKGESRREVPASYAETWHPRLHFAWSELRAMRVGDWKYIAAPKPELYDLRVDPGELKNAMGAKGGVANRLAGEMASLAARVQPSSPTLRRSAGSRRSATSGHSRRRPPRAAALTRRTRSRSTRPTAASSRRR
jgi:arylsulfatase A-like enzyme